MGANLLHFWRYNSEKITMVEQFALLHNNNNIGVKKPRPEWEPIFLHFWRYNSEKIMMVEQIEVELFCAVA